MNDMMNEQLKDAMAAVIESLNKTVLCILAECRDMIDDAIEEKEEINKRHSQMVHILSSMKNFGKEMNPVEIIWNPGWLAWEQATFTCELVRLLNPGINNSWQVRGYFTNNEYNVLEKFFSIPTAKQLAGEIGGTKVIAYEDKHGDVWIEKSGYTDLLNGDKQIVKVICEKLNIPILPWEQIVEQYGGNIPELEAE